jgi:hypothetical protein
MPALKVMYMLVFLAYSTGENGIGKQGNPSYLEGSLL